MREMRKNRIFFFAACCVITVLIFAYTNLSYAQSSSLQNQFLSEDKIVIFVQTFVYNSQGDLVTYLVSDKFTDVQMNKLKVLLDDEKTENDPIITIYGKKFQIIQRQQTIDYNRENVVASTILSHSQNDELVLVARFAHDGYPIIDGETVVSAWTFIMPLE